MKIPTPKQCSLSLHPKKEWTTANKNNVPCPTTDYTFFIYIIIIFSLNKCSLKTSSFVVSSFPNLSQGTSMMITLKCTQFHVVHHHAWL